MLGALEGFAVHELAIDNATHIESPPVSEISDLPPSSHESKSKTPSHSVQVDGLEEFFDVNAIPIEGMTIEEASEHYGLTQKKLKKLMKEGAVPALKLGEEPAQEWRVFPSGIPDTVKQQRKAQKKRAQAATADKKKSKQLRHRDEMNAIEGELISLRTDVTMLDERLSKAADTISMMTYEMDVMKQLMGQVGVTATWLNNRLLEVNVDRAGIERFPAKALIAIGPDGRTHSADAANFADEDAGEEEAATHKPKKRGGVLMGILRWLGRNL